MISMSAKHTASHDPVPAGRWPAPFAGHDLADFRLFASKAYLATRDTSFGRLREVVRGQVDGIAHLLLTSSPVHGLANATSDIDTICVVDGGDHVAERTATQIFDQANHYETILFTRAEITSELDRLGAVANASAAAQVAAYKTWDKGGPLARKYLERLINGVDSDRSLPYFDQLPGLAALWRAASTSRALVALECATLAERSIQSRAALGYVINALLYAMDALMSHHGHVFSNKKWFLLRYRRFVKDAAIEPDLADVAAELNELWGNVVDVLQRGGPTIEIARDARALLARMQHAFGFDLGTHAVWTRAERSMQTPYLPGADALLHENMVSLIMPLGSAGSIPFGSGATAPPAFAGGLLNAARSGVFTPRFGMEGAST